jgi:hypothetical protein
MQTVIWINAHENGKSWALVKGIEALIDPRSSLLNRPHRSIV